MANPATGTRVSPTRKRVAAPVADADPRHPLAVPSELDQRLRRSLEQQHFSSSTENGPAAYFLCLVRAAREGDHRLALAIHDRLKRLGWDCREIELPERGGHNR